MDWQLINAIKGNDYYQVFYIITQHTADINTEDANKKTPLHLAIDNKNLNIVKLLVENGADVNKKDQNGNTSLLYSICNHAYEISSYLINHGADVNIPNNEDRTSLFQAVNFKQDKLVFELINKGADVNKASHGYTSLSLAVSYQNLEIVKYLLNHGADTDTISNLTKLDPFEEAIRRCNIAIIDCLFYHDPNILLKRYKQIIDKTYDEKTKNHLCELVFDHLFEESKKHKNENEVLKNENKKLKDTINLIERFLGDDYAKFKKEENQLVEKDE